MFPEQGLDGAHDPVLTANLDAIADLERLLVGSDGRSPPPRPRAEAHSDSRSQPHRVRTIRAESGESLRGGERVVSFGPTPGRLPASDLLKRRVALPPKAGKSAIELDRRLRAGMLPAAVIVKRHLPNLRTSTTRPAASNARALEAKRAVA